MFLIYEKHNHEYKFNWITALENKNTELGLGLLLNKRIKMF